MDLPERKTNRLQNYDYCENGVYFITICIKDNKEILSRIVGECLCALPNVVLSPIGKCVGEKIKILKKNRSA